MVLSQPVGYSAQATIAADGTATATLPPVPVGTVWQLQAVTVNSTSAQRTSCTLYRGISNTQVNIIEKSVYSGNADTTDTAIRLNSGEQLRAVWAGGTPGAACQVTITGQQESQQ